LILQLQVYNLKLSKMTYRSKTVFLNLDESFTEWLRRELKDQLSNRYKIVHLAEDMGVPNITLYRFLHGKEVRTPFYDSAFKYLVKK
jgi:predicted transcriptional regulator